MRTNCRKVAREASFAEIASIKPDTAKELLQGQDNKEGRPRRNVHTHGTRSDVKATSRLQAQNGVL